MLATKSNEPMAKYYAMGFYNNGYGSTVVRAVRINPFKNMNAAIRAVKRVGQGYVKQYSVKAPVWSNLSC